MDPVHDGRSMDLVHESGVRTKTWTRGPWTPTLDWVHGPLVHDFVLTPVSVQLLLLCCPPLMLL